MKKARPKDLLVPLEQNILRPEGRNVGVHVRAKMLLLFLYVLGFFHSRRKEMTYWFHWGFGPDLIPNEVIIPPS